MQVVMSVLTNRFAHSQFLIKFIWMYFLPSPLMTRNQFLHGPHLKAGMVAMFWAMRNAWSMFYSVVVLVEVFVRIGACGTCHGKPCGKRKMPYAELNPQPWRTKSLVIKMYPLHQTSIQHSGQQFHINSTIVLLKYKAYTITEMGQTTTANEHNYLSPMH